MANIKPRPKPQIPIIISNAAASQKGPVNMDYECIKQWEFLIHYEITNYSIHKDVLCCLQNLTTYAQKTFDSCKIFVPV